MTAAYIRDSLEAPEVICLSDCWTVSFRELCLRLVEYFLIGRVFRKHLKRVWPGYSFTAQGRPVRTEASRPEYMCECSSQLNQRA